MARAGEIIRNHLGGWVDGFVVNLGSCSVMEVECLGVVHGLCTAWDLGVKNLIVESDSKNVVDILHRHINSPIRLKALFNEIERSRLLLT